MTSYYSLAVEGGYPRIRGPYATAEEQKAVIRAMVAEREATGEYMPEVFYLDIQTDGPQAGRVLKQDWNFSIGTPMTNEAYLAAKFAAARKESK